MATTAVDLAVLGGGRMGEALAVGLVAAGRPPASLRVVEHSESRRQDLHRRLPGVDVTAELGSVDAVVVAVKPRDVAGACPAITASGAHRVLSVAAGVTLATLEGALPGVAVVRAMPNTPALVGAGASAISAGSVAGEEEMAWAEEILSSVGLVVRVAESDLDAVTGLSGSGPAYLFLLVESLVEAGVHVGLTRDTSQALVVQTVLGSARLLAESGDPAAVLREAVTSPAGTTAAAVRVLESAAVRSAYLEAVAAATERSRELGRP